MENKGKILLQKYDVGKLLGQGNFAKVYRARNLETGEIVAVKVIDKEKILKVGMMDQIKREICAMRVVKHPNIVQLHEVLATKTKIYLVMEYVKGGELFNKIAKGKLKEDIARNYFQQLISAVDFCHSRGVYHRDLKLENLLLDKNGSLKVTDFGLSTLVESSQEDMLLHTTCGTPAYVAPEVVSRKGYDGAKADIWSCGIILYVLLAGYLPFSDSNLVEMYKKMLKAEYKRPNWFSPEVRRLLSRILNPNPCKRISIEKITENPWFRKRFSYNAFKSDTEANEPAPLENADATNTIIELPKSSTLNAFDIISLSTGFDLSGLFAQNDENKVIQFTSTFPASFITSKLEVIAKHMKMKVSKNDKGLKLEGLGGRKGTLCIDVDIYEFTPSFHLVEVKKSIGDALEYKKIMELDIKPALKDIVWTLPGEHQRLRQ